MLQDKHGIQVIQSLVEEALAEEAQSEEDNMALRSDEIPCGYGGALNYGSYAPCIFPCEVEATGCEGRYTFSHSADENLTVDPDSVTECEPIDPLCGGKGDLLAEYGVYILAGGSLLFLLFALNKK